MMISIARVASQEYVKPVNPRLHLFCVATMLLAACEPAAAEVSRKAAEQVTLDMSVETAAPLIGAPLFVPVGDGAEDPSPKLTVERAYVEDAKSDGRLRRGAINFVAKGHGVAILEGINCEDGSTAHVVIPEGYSKHNYLINDKLTINPPGLSLEPVAAIYTTSRQIYQDEGHLLFSPATKVMSTRGLKCNLVLENQHSFNVRFMSIVNIEELVSF